MNKKLRTVLLTIAAMFLMVPVFLPQKVNAATTAPETFEYDGAVYKIEYDENKTIVTEYRNNVKIGTTSYDKSEKVLTVSDSEDNETEYTLEELKSAYKLQSNYTSLASYSYVNIKSRFSAYQYQKSGGRHTFTISDGGAKSKNVYYSSRTAGYITSFRRNIEDIRSAELEVIAALGWDMAVAVISGVFSAGIGAIIAIVGTLPSIISAGNKIILASNRARVDYYAVWSIFL